MTAAKQLPIGSRVLLKGCRYGETGRVLRIERRNVAVYVYLVRSRLFGTAQPGIAVVDRVSAEVEPLESFADYVRTKREKMGHIQDLLVTEEQAG
jgi:hypothetical protein